MSPCEDLISYVDGELDAPAADAFREHLETCDDCPARLVEAVQLAAQLSTLRDRPRPEAETARAAAAPAPSGQTPHRRALPWHLARWVALAAAAVLGIGIVVQVRHPPPASDAFAGVTHRPFEVRLAYAGATAHHPPSDPMLGAAPAPLADAIRNEAIIDLEQRGDRHGVAIAKLWNERRPADAERELTSIEQTDSVRSDRAAMAVLTMRLENAEPVLASLESLRRSSDPGVARAARWNQALLLSRLELSLSAARAFQDIAGERERGWSEEARARAAQELRRGNDFRARWKEASSAGNALVQQGTRVPDELVAAFPGVLRAYFYHAVRVAPSVDRVQALAPMAAALDRLGDPGQRTLRDYVDRVARLDFARRAPLAGAYATRLRGGAVPGPLGTQLVTETGSADLADIVMGAMVEAGITAQHRAWFQQRVDADRDPWFQVLLSRDEASVDRRDGDWFAAEKKLLDAEKLCTPALRYQCLLVERHLGELYQDLHRIPDALRVLRRGVADARAAGEWGRYENLLTQLADAERFHDAPATVRAYAGELLQMADTCEARKRGYRRLTGAAILDDDGRAARDYLAEARKLPCETIDLPLAAFVSDIAILDPKPDDLAQLREMLGTLRASSRPTAPEQAVMDALEGRVAAATGRGRAAGVALLEKAIAAADARRDDVVARKARAAAYSALVFHAGNANDHTEVLNLVARDLHLALPRTCAVAMAAEGNQAVVVVRGADGKDQGRYVSGRVQRPGPLTVPGELARGLAGCSQVGVMAPAALQGTPRVLPDGVAWGYLAGAIDRAAAPAPPAGPRTLIVTNVTPPANLELQPLSIQPPDQVSAQRLSGDAATPARVANAMTDATEIQFHTHALLDVGVSDASHLVLSPESPGGPYALTAEAIRKLALRGHPTVALEACRSAQGARYEHAPWSLPDAFLAAGARAVFAAATEIPDVASGQFFARVLARVRGGAAPAVALRDERVAMLETEPGNPWVAGVIVFEQAGL